MRPAGGSRLLLPASEVEHGRLLLAALLQQAVANVADKARAVRDASLRATGICISWRATSRSLHPDPVIVLFVNDKAASCRQKTPVRLRRRPGG
jgi:uncharacterized protein YggE